MNCSIGNRQLARRPSRWRALLAGTPPRWPQR